MTTDITNDNTAGAGTNVVDSKSPGDTIEAETFKEMIDNLDALIQHNHTFTDDYTTNCQCNCGRGNL